MGIVDDTFGTHIFGDNATDRAVNAQSSATRDANQMAREMYDQTREDVRPFREVGLKNLSQLEDEDFSRDFTMSDYQQDPGYQFRLDEANKAIERSAAARGGLNSGATMKALARYSQDYAANEYQNAYNRFNSDRDRRFNRLSSLANYGLQSTGMQVDNSKNYSNMYGQNVTNMANATAAANIAQANRTTGFMGQGLTAAGIYAASDERVKTNIKPIDKNEFMELKKHIKPYWFKYKNPEHGEGDYVGVMAQDLEKSKIGKTLVVEKNGIKMIDLNRVLMLYLANLAEE